MMGRIQFEALSYRGLQDIQWFGNAMSAGQHQQLWSIKIEVSEHAEDDPDGYAVTELLFTPDAKMLISEMIPYVLDTIEAEEFRPVRVDVSAMIRRPRR